MSEPELSALRSSWDDPDRMTTQIFVGAEFYRHVGLGNVREAQAELDIDLASNARTHLETQPQKLESVAQ